MDNISTWFLSSGVKIALIFAGALFLHKFSMYFIKRAVSKSLTLDKDSTQRAHELREKTIVRIINSIVMLSVWIVAIIMAVSSLGVNIAPLIAGAGILGIAIGFGAQDLVKDLIAGLFIIVENQYRIDDVVQLDTVGGKVENISLRITSLRDMDGNIHHIPNGNIQTVTNKTMDFSKINMNIGVSYDSDIDQVEKVVNEVGAEIGKDQNWKADILEAPHFLRLAHFGDSSVEIKIVGKTKPTRQWAVAGELRKRLKKAFEENSIEIPYPQMVVRKK